MLSIRKASAKDIDVIADFQLRLAAETENVKLEAEVVTKGLKALLADPAKGTYYLAVDDGEPVGCHLITFEWSEWRNGNVWWLQSVYVKESHRKKKVFSAMYENIRQMINNDPGVLGLRLYVDKSNQRAQQVYNSLGMNGEHYTVFEWMK